MSNPNGPRKNWRGPTSRLLVFLVIAAVAGTLLNRAGRALGQDGRPAGFGRGMVEGALMPMAWPNLLIGRDVAIYSTENVGVPYKLGYTAGVNGCGALFFGVLYWRFNRWRKKGNSSPELGKRCVE